MFFLSTAEEGHSATKAGMATHNRADDCWKSDCCIGSLQGFHFSGVVVCPIPNHCPPNGGGLTDHGNASGARVFLPLLLFVFS